MYLANIWLLDGIAIPIFAVEESGHVFLEGLEWFGGRIAYQLDTETARSLHVRHVDLDLFIVLRGPRLPGVDRTRLVL
jgi:hypothetical protein